MSEKIFLSKTEYLKNHREKSELFGLLPEWRWIKYQKIKNEQAECESLLAGMLLVKGLCRYAGIEGNEARDLFDSENHILQERKLIMGIDNKPLYYSISHSGGYVAVAYSDIPVGIDIETKDDKDFRVTARMFSDEDKAYVGDSQKRFRDIWTVKESFLKCRGTGINVPLNSFSSELIAEDASSQHLSWNIVSKGLDISGKYYAVTGEAGDEKGCISICSENPNLKLDIEWVEVLI